MVELRNASLGALKGRPYKTSGVGANGALGADGDDAEEAPARGGFFAVAEEVGNVTGSAERTDGDVLLAKAGFQKLEVVGFF